jgi:hypothetical protein
MKTTKVKPEVKAIKGLLKIAAIAMPDTYYATDSRVKYAKKVLAKLEGK